LKRPQEILGEDGTVSREFCREVGMYFTKEKFPLRKRGIFHEE